jgi:hypothetical protein
MCSRKLAQRLLPSIRLYLQFSFVDFATYLLGMVILVFKVYKPKDWKDDLCEEVSVHPDVLRALRSGGFDIENCESWVENLMLGMMTLLGVGLILKVQWEGHQGLLLTDDSSAPIYTCHCIALHFISQGNGTSSLVFLHYTGSHRPKNVQVSSRSTHSVNSTSVIRTPPLQRQPRHSYDGP